MPPGVPLLRKQLLCVVDQRSTMVCLDAAGQIRPIDQPFHTLAGQFQAPPFHRWCRSVTTPYLEGFVETHRADANTEINRRPLAERRKGPGGIGARIPPPAHSATHDRRAEIGDVNYADILNQVLDAPAEDHHAALARYLDDPTDTDRQLRTGHLNDVQAPHVAELDTAIRTTRLREQVTGFTALRGDVAATLRAGDIISDDTYLVVSLNPTIAKQHGHPVAITLPAGQPAAILDRDTQRLLLARRHSWQLIALGIIIIGLLL